MKVVVDSNIVFSALLNTKSKIGNLLINGATFFDFYSVGLLRNEILRHKKKILKITGFSQKQFDDTFQIITSRIKFIDDILISDKDFKKSIELVSDIDINDSMFISFKQSFTISFLDRRQKVDFRITEKRIFKDFYF